MSTPRLLITTGDADGIGLEVAKKALVKFRSARAKVLVFTDAKAKILGLSVKRISSLQDFVDPHLKNGIYQLASSDSPALWVQEAAQFCLEHKDSCLVTGPLSKTLIRKSGLSDMGHTGILKRIAKEENVFMTFVGRKFSVLLATDHIPLREVPDAITVELIQRAVRAAASFSKTLHHGKKLRPVAILGLNPHAGESGLLGSEEGQVIQSALRTLALTPPPEGPLVPDAAFRQQNWSRHSVFVALYHDQGLIPFKTIHSSTGAHVSWGLPFVRTSVDHGTAKDIYGKNKADPASMIEAIRLAMSLHAKRRKVSI